MLMLELGFRFFCCGLFAIGGGLATLPFLYNISKETGWYTFSDISNMIAVSESTPARRAHGDVFARAAVGHHHCDYLEDSR